MLLRPSITPDQYLSVVQAIRSRQTKMKKTQWPGVLIGAIIGLCLVFLFEYQATRASAYVLSFLFVVYAVLCKPYFRRKYRQAVRQSYDQQAAILNGNEMEVTARGISGSWVSNQASYDFTWKAFETYIDRPDCILFLYAPCCWVRLPKDQLTDEDQAMVLAWYKADHDPVFL